jgi:hypothetical protein
MIASFGAASYLIKLVSWQENFALRGSLSSYLALAKYMKEHIKNKKIFGLLEECCYNMITNI